MNDLGSAPFLSGPPHRARTGFPVAARSQPWPFAALRGPGSSSARAGLAAEGAARGRERAREGGRGLGLRAGGRGRSGVPRPGSLAEGEAGRRRRRRRREGVEGGAAGGSAPRLFLPSARNSSRPRPAPSATPGSRTSSPPRPRPAFARATPTAGRRPRFSRLQRRENEPGGGGGGAAQGHHSGGDRGRPRHHVERPHSSSRGPGRSAACLSPLASPALRVASRPEEEEEVEEEVEEEEEEEEAAPPSPRRASSPLSALAVDQFGEMCDLIEPQPPEKIGKMKKLRRTLSDSFSRIALKKDDTTFDEVG
ncbi:hypothetical protein J1605_002111 [Eschrichtius robustus]|uniref:Uncharacterized protein n=1 Tax=Eschrichtius robustus TaxID=9764 RepID=A0AB34HYU0_ESCRO|nr:hypothetical protein J1605_002111 [Eschrichtius robustus]